MTAPSKIKIANTQGFWGDRPIATAWTLALDPEIDFVTLDYLAEVSMGIMAIQKEKNPKLGYAQDFVDVIRSVVPLWKQGMRAKIITNGGGLNPKGCGEACQALLKEMGIEKSIAVIDGDDVQDKKEKIEGLDTLKEPVLTANAYLGAVPIAEALKMGADIVITGRVADPSLTVGPCLYSFRWSPTDYDRLAQATVAGHLIECGTQVSGGISTNWLNMSQKEMIGYPIVEIDSTGIFIVTKPLKTGGNVNIETVKEQLLYELGDPSKYISPDVVVSFLEIDLESEGENRIRVKGAKGFAPTNSYKVSVTYRAGFQAESFLVVTGPDPALKASEMGKIVFSNLAQQGISLKKTCIETLGSDSKNECVLRIAVADDNLEAIHAWGKEIAPLVTSGSQGVTGYLRGRPKPRPVCGFMPGFIDKSLVHPEIHLLKNEAMGCAH